jgi:hypothetical protein
LDGLTAPNRAQEKQDQNMKMARKTAVCLSAIITTLVSGCTVTMTPNGVVATGPEPVVVVAPETYVWDGVEYVGFYNGQYMYLNGGGVWVVCDEARLARFHGWERGHPDWRREAIHYDRGHRPDPRRAPRPEDRR